MYFQLRNPNSEKETPIILKIYLPYEKKYFKYSIGSKVKPEDWNDGMPIKARGEKGKTLRHLEGILIRLKTTINNTIRDAEAINVPLTSDLLNSKLRKKKTITRVVDAFDLAVNTRKRVRSITPATIKKYNTVKNIIEKYEKFAGISLTFDKVDAPFMSKFIEYSYNELGHVDNTVGRNIGHIRSILSWCQDQGIHSSEKYKALRRFSVDADRVTLTREEVMALYHCKFDASRHDKARDVFLIGVFSGQRYSDYSVFDQNDYRDGFILKRSKKTNEKAYVPVDDNKYLKALLEKHNWIVPKITNQKLNLFIKEACKIAKIDTLFKYTVSQGVEKQEEIQPKHKLVGTHTARRTFITLALENGMTYKQVMKITGIRKVETLLRYDHANKESLGRSIRKVFP